MYMRSEKSNPLYPDFDGVYLLQIYFRFLNNSEMVTVVNTVYRMSVNYSLLNYLYIQLLIISRN